MSGNSLGMVKLWDSVTCTQLQTFTAHEADVLALTIGPQGDSLYPAGVDQKTTEFLCCDGRFFLLPYLFVRLFSQSILLCEAQ